MIMKDNFVHIRFLLDLMNIQWHAVARVTQIAPQYHIRFRNKPPLYSLLCIN